MTVHELLTGNSTENCAIKCEQIAATVQAGVYQSGGTKIEMGAVTNLDGKAVVVLARAWDEGGNPIGFGTDGSVEWERFRFFNPPIMVADGTKRQITICVADRDLIHEVDNFKEDLTEALRQAIAHNIKVVGRPGATVTPGKIGNTTSTFYPDAGTGATTVDGYVERNGPVGSGWSPVRNATVGNRMGDTDAQQVLAGTENGSGNYYVMRSFFLFDTSSIPDTDSIITATLSFYVYLTEDKDNDGKDYVSIFTVTPAANNDLVLEDFDQIGSTEQHDSGQRKDITNVSTGAYTDWTLNSTGMGNISKTGITKFGAREGHDIENEAPDLHSSLTGGNYLLIYHADQAGTAYDPKLVVEHAGTNTGGFFFRFL